MHSIPNDFHTSFQKYLHTDMAAEQFGENAREAAAGEKGSIDGVVTQEEAPHGIRLQRVQLKTPAAAERFGRTVGTYSTLFDDGEKSEAALTAALCDEIGTLCAQLAPGAKRILIAGIGNRAMTCDAIGPMTVDGLETVVGSVLYALAPGVLGQTGMETQALIHAAAGVCKAELVILVDALAAQTTDWLCATVQLSTVGIHPGGGVGNQRHAITRETLGVPVMTIGVPTVIDSATLLFSALDAAQLPPAAMNDGVQKRLEGVFNRCQGMFVTVKDADSAAVFWSRVLSGGIRQAFCTAAADKE